MGVITFTFLPQPFAGGVPFLTRPVHKHSIIGPRLEEPPPSDRTRGLPESWRLLLRGKVLVCAAGDGKATEAPRGRTVLTGPAWIWRDGIGYVLPAGCRATLKIDAQKGRWTDINKDCGK